MRLLQHFGLLFFNKLGFINYAETDNSFDYIFEINYAIMDKNELDNIIETWRELPPSSRHNDVGFKLKGQSQKIYWLSNALAKAELKLPLVKEYGVLKAYELASALIENKSKIVILKND